MKSAAEVFAFWRPIKELWKGVLRYRTLGGSSWFAGMDGYSYPLTPEYAHRLIRDEVVRRGHEAGHYIGNWYDHDRQCIMHSIHLDHSDEAVADFADYDSAVLALGNTIVGEG
jgi:hypothetical protein